MAEITVPIQVNLPDDWTEQIIERLKNDPEAEWAQIIRCKDCIHWWESHRMCKRNKDKNHNCACMNCDADFYCKNAERRTNEARGCGCANNK